MDWTSDQIIAIAPDPASAKAGKGLSSPAKWTGLGSDGLAAWGQCQGSGKDPYRTCIELLQPAFKCSCPSRKFPCKHSLGLFFLFADKPDVFGEKQAPEWVQQWLASRKEKSEKRGRKNETAADKEADSTNLAKRAAGQVKRQEAREGKVAAGVEELGRFLRDIARQGIAGLEKKPFSFWDSQAARLVDAQAPGLARMVKLAGQSVYGGPGWQERLMVRLGRLHLLVEAHGRLDLLPPELEADVRAMIGFTSDQNEIIALDGLRDNWLCLGRRTDEEERLKVRRTWLMGEKTGQPALLLQFAYGNGPLDAGIPAGSRVDAELVFHPSTFPMRAILKNRFSEITNLEAIPWQTGIEDALNSCASALGATPFMELFPLWIGKVFPVLSDGQWGLVDFSGDFLPIKSKNGEGRLLQALGGDRPIGVFGEWDGDSLLPLSAVARGRFADIRLASMVSFRAN